MKRNFLIILTILGFNLFTYSQSPYGFYGGVNYGGFSGKGVTYATDNDFKHSNTTNFSFGVRGLRYLHLESDKINFKGISFDLGISQRAANFNIETSDSGFTFGNKSSFKYTYFDLAIDHIISKQISKLVSINLINGFYGSAAFIGKYRSKYYAENLPDGVTFEDLLEVLGEKEKTEINLLDAKENEKKSADFGFRSGLGLNMGKISLRAQYHFGLIDITGRHEEKFMNRFWSFNLFYRFWKIY